MKNEIDIEMNNNDILTSNINKVINNTQNDIHIINQQINELKISIPTLNDSVLNLCSCSSVIHKYNFELNTINSIINNFKN